MRLNIGPLQGLLVQEKWTFTFVALETASQPGMPKWNQIHIGGSSPRTPADREKLQAARTLAMRRLNPNGSPVPLEIRFEPDPRLTKRANCSI
jgi:hypothetical protein